MTGTLDWTGLEAHGADDVKAGVQAEYRVGRGGQTISLGYEHCQCQGIRR